MARALIRRTLLAPPPVFRLALHFPGTSSHMSMSSSSPRYSGSRPQTVFSVSFWKSLVPKPLRRGEGKLREKSGEWNPVSIYIILFLLIGSMSINMIAHKKEEEEFTRRSTVRIDILKDVIERVKKGEDVDVDKALGTGDPAKEQGWEELIREIERDEAQRPKQKTEKPKSVAPEQPTKMEPTRDKLPPKTRTERPAFF